MNRKFSAIALVLIAATSAAAARQAQDGGGPRDDGYVNTYQPKVKLSDPNERIKDDPVGRREARREQMGGDLSPEFVAALMAAGDAERAKYGPDGRGAIGVAAGPAWTNIGPYRGSASTRRLTAARRGICTAAACRSWWSPISTCQPMAATCACRPTAAGSGKPGFRSI